LPIPKSDATHSRGSPLVNAMRTASPLNSSLCLMISSVSWNGPRAGFRDFLTSDPVPMLRGKWLAHPSHTPHPVLGRHCWFARASRLDAAGRDQRRAHLRGHAGHRVHHQWFRWSVSSDDHGLGLPSCRRLGGVDLHLRRSAPHGSIRLAPLPWPNEADFFISGKRKCRTTMPMNGARSRYRPAGGQGQKGWHGGGQCSLKGGGGLQAHPSHFTLQRRASA
jgi:hypothetical protein